MENPDREQLADQQEVAKSEFAEKSPLVAKELVRRLVIGLFSVVGVVVIGFALTALLTNNNKPIIIGTPAIVESVPEAPKEPVSTFAYIKNQTAIFVADENGQEKQQILAIPVSAKGIYTSLIWKTETQLTFSKCIENACEIMTYNLGNKSLTPEVVSNSNYIHNFAWSPNQRYFAYVSTEENKTNLHFKLGTVNNILKSIPTAKDATNTKTKVLFTNDSQYVIYAILAENVLADGVINYPITYVYQLNGAQIDEIAYASDPFLISENTIGYKRDGKLLYKTIGEVGESEITPFIGYNPEISPDFKKFAYWSNENSGNSVILGLYDSTLNIHRNILRGVVLPVWISNDKIAGIQADSCLGEQCLLYEFQTTSLVIVDVTNGKVTPVDQGKSISKVVFRKYAD